MYEIAKLKNGITLVSHEMRETETVSVGVFVQLGSRHEDRHTAGFSHFAEHLLLKKALSGVNRNLVEDMGGIFCAYTMEEYTVYFIKVVKKYLETALKLLSNLITISKFSKSEIDKERTVVLEEIKRHKDLQQNHSLTLLAQLLWPGQSLGYGELWEKNVEQVKYKDITSFINKKYTSSNLIIGMAGTVSHEKFVKITKKQFKNVMIGAENTFVPLHEAASDLAPIKMCFKRTNQNYIAMGTYAVSRNHPDRYIVELISTILDVKPSSRLFHELREKRGLVYEVGTIVDCLHDAGSFLIYTATKSRDIRDLLDIILNELEKIKAGHVKNRELLKAKEYYKNILLMKMENTLEHLFWMGDQMISKKTLSVREVFQEIDKITCADIKRVANNIFRKDKLKLVIVGPMREKERTRLIEILRDKKK